MSSPLLPEEALLPLPSAVVFHTCAPPKPALNGTQHRRPTSLSQPTSHTHIVGVQEASPNFTKPAANKSEGHAP